MDREKIVSAVIEVVENGLRESAPEGMAPEEVQAVLTLGRKGLEDTANLIADKILA